MPVHFIPDVEFVWPPVRPAEVRAPEPPGRPRAARCPPKPKKKKLKAKRKAKKKAKRKARPKISAQCLTILDDRLEAAVTAGVIDLHDDWDDCDQLCITGGEYALLLRILCPEAYREPKKRPAKPTLTPPASAERIAEYAKRVEDGRPWVTTGDAGAVNPKTGQQITLAERKNGTGLRVTGWTARPG